MIKYWTTNPKSDITLIYNRAVWGHTSSVGVAFMLDNQSICLKLLINK